LFDELIESSDSQAFSILGQVRYFLLLSPQIAFTVGNVLPIFGIQSRREKKKKSFEISFLLGDVWAES
jgi:hypothetical protein